MIRVATKVLCLLTILMWGICVAFPINEIHFGWIGTASGSLAGILATIRSYLTQDMVLTRGGVVYKKDSPIDFFISYLLIGLVLGGFLIISVLGSIGIVTVK